MMQIGLGDVKTVFYIAFGQKCLSNRWPWPIWWCNLFTSWCIFWAKWPRYTSPAVVMYISFGRAKPQLPICNFSLVSASSVLSPWNADNDSPASHRQRLIQWTTNSARPAHEVKLQAVVPIAFLWVKCINNPRSCRLCLKLSSNSRLASLQSSNLLRMFIYGPKYVDQRITLKSLMCQGIKRTDSSQAA
jgi:hypothetical protein